jgi:hypothetical protein
MFDPPRAAALPIPDAIGEVPEVAFLPHVLLFFYLAFRYLPDSLVGRHSEHMAEKVRRMSVPPDPDAPPSARVRQGQARTRNQVAVALTNLFRREAVYAALERRLVQLGEHPSMIPQIARGMARTLQSRPELLER